MIYVNTSRIDTDLPDAIASASGCILSPHSKAELIATASPMPAFAAETTFPERIDPRPWLKVENQGNVGSCAGHSLTTVMEGAYYLATAGSIQLCRNFAYVMAQKVDGINGDQGSTVSGGVKVATSSGLCREELWKYSGSYVRNPPGGWDPLLKDAANYVAGGQTPVDNYDQAFKFLASRLGWIHTGFMWGDVIDQQAARGGIIERWAPGGGGHSVAFCGYTPEKTDKNGRPYLINPNSWSERWGLNGYALWSPDAFDAMCAHRWSEVVGIHSLKLGKDAVIPNWI